MNVKKANLVIFIKKIVPFNPNCSYINLSYSNNRCGVLPRNGNIKKYRSIQGKCGKIYIIQCKVDVVSHSLREFIKQNIRKKWNHNVNFSTL